MFAATERSRRVQETVLFDEQGMLLEATTAAVMILKSGVLNSPPPEAGVLPSVTAGRFASLAKTFGVDHRYKMIAYSELFRADAVLHINALGGVRLLTALDDCPLMRLVEAPQMLDWYEAWVSSQATGV